jgi:beta-lactam-binding protein with PASTA domain
VLGRILSLVLGLAVVAFIAYWALNHVADAQRPDPEGRSQAKAVLDRTRETTRRIEQDTERRRQEAEQKIEER